MDIECRELHRVGRDNLISLSHEKNFGERLPRRTLPIGLIRLLRHALKDCVVFLSTTLHTQDNVLLIEKRKIYSFVRFLNGNKKFICRIIGNSIVHFERMMHSTRNMLSDFFFF